MEFEIEKRTPEIINSWTRRGQRFALVQVAHSSDLVDPKVSCAGDLITRVSSSVMPRNHYRREFCYSCGQRVVVNKVVIGIAARVFQGLK